MPSQRAAVRAFEFDKDGKLVPVTVEVKFDEDEATQKSGANVNKQDRELNKAVSDWKHKGFYKREN